MLRQYQIDMIESLRILMREHRRVLAVLPTGAGKTQIFCSIAARAIGKNNNVLILVHRTELLEQTSCRLQAMDVTHGLIAPKRPTAQAQIQVASIQAMARRIDALPWAPNLIIVDEAHHCTARTWRRVIDTYGLATVIGWTATPERLDGKGLGGSFDAMVEGPSTCRLIEMGYLAQYELYAPPANLDLSKLRKRAGEYRTEDVVSQVDRINVVHDAVQNYIKYAAGRSTIAFCASVKHAMHVCQQFQKVGIDAEPVDGTLPAAERTKRMERFKSGATRVLVSVDLISEGFDVPSCECVLMMRPTASLALYLQQVGRGLRPSSKSAVILDCVGNSLVHGLPDQTRDWSLDSRPTKARGSAQAVPVRVCPGCYRVHPPALKCQYCGYVYQNNRQLPKEIKVDLVRINHQEAVRQRQGNRREQAAAATLEELVAVGQRRGMKNPRGWAMHVLAARQTKGQWRNLR